MPEPTTIEELRDWLAWKEWDYLPECHCDLEIIGRHSGWKHRTKGVLSHHHPIAPTIDAAVLAFPEGWGMWDRNTSTGFMSAYRAIPDDQDDPRSRIDFIRAEVKITGHTPEAIRRDLLALARLAWIAEGAEP